MTRPNFAPVITDPPDTLLPRTWAESRRGMPVSPREIETLRFIASGATTSELAHLLGVAEQTAKNHRSSLLAKLDARSSAHAVAIAYETGLVTKGEGNPDPIVEALTTAHRLVEVLTRAIRRRHALDRASDL